MNWADATRRRITIGADAFVTPRRPAEMTSSHRHAEMHAEMHGWVCQTRGTYSQPREHTHTNATRIVGVAVLNIREHGSKVDHVCVCVCTCTHIYTHTQHAQHTATEFSKFWPWTRL